MAARSAAPRRCRLSPPASSRIPTSIRCCSSRPATSAPRSSSTAARSPTCRRVTTTPTSPPRWRRCCRAGAAWARNTMRCWSKAPAARPRSICATATSPTWALPRRRTCRWCWWPTSTAAASSPTWSAPSSCCRRPSRRGCGASSSTASAATSACCSPASTGWRRAPGARCSVCCPICTGCSSTPRMRWPMARPTCVPARARCAWWRRCIRAFPTIPMSTRCDCIHRSISAGSGRGRRFRRPT